MAEAARLMDRHQVTCLPVAGENGQLLGVRQARGTCYRSSSAQTLAAELLVAGVFLGVAAAALILVPVRLAARRRSRSWPG